MKKIIVILSVIFSIAVLAGCSFILCHNGHKYGDWTYKKAPNCTEGGEAIRECLVCGNLQTATLEPDPEAHIWDDGVVTTKATCKVAGVKTYTCTVCNETKTKEIKDKTHSEYKIKCPYCGDWFVTQSFVGIAAKDGDGLDVTVTKWTKTVGENYDTYYLSYTIENNVADSKFLPGTFDIIMEDGTEESQFGFFNYIYTGESDTRSYSWKILHTQKPLVLKYSKSFGSSKVTLYWDVPQD